MQGKSLYAWDPTNRSYIGIMRGVVRFQILNGLSDPAYVFHPMNAHNDGDRLLAMCSEEAPLFPHG